ncbi:GNAT family N-acetyltransferase [Microbacterium sp. NEAU-LLC]|uniref:GNAT family N-acetyltransferase n=1 Tax=Microbacterium helvum TaxID=2773713 RepID=A0ABR8NJT1_9MICO|nr:GNAT family protein [Microbacterium helvum]MBD3940915.1 GNAT family N-acetyltransferase [Microbacterium helvum]
MPHPDTLARLWPASAIRARAGDLELRWIDDELVVELAELAGRGIHHPDAMPFDHPWTRGTADEVARSVLLYQWESRGHVSPETFRLELAVLHRGVPVGIQSMTAKDWTVLRAVQTGSWLGLEHQGQGLGTRMRALVLQLAFEGFGAQEARSGAFADNPASNGVSRRLGYEPDGAYLSAREGVAALHNRYVMSRERWQTQRAAHEALLGAPVELRGVEALRTPAAG